MVTTARKCGAALMIFVAAICTLALQLTPGAYAASGASGSSVGSSQKAATNSERVDKARERCRANRGVDCDSAAGVKEWVLQERPRAEAVRDGSRVKPSGTR